MLPIISIVGHSDSGKTTLIERLVPELVRRGYQVGTVKHDVHGFDIDHPGKDSYRHFQSGTMATVISSPAKVAMVRKVSRELRLDEIVHRYLADVDLVLTEGYKQENKLKIELVRVAPGADVFPEILSPPGDLVALAVIGSGQPAVPPGLPVVPPVIPAKAGIHHLTPPPTSYADVPVISADDVTALADHIQQDVLASLPTSSVQLLVDGSAIPLKPIMEAMVANTVTGLISALKGCEHPGKIELRIDKK